MIGRGFHDLSAFTKSRGSSSPLAPCGRELRVRNSLPAARHLFLVIILGWVAARPIFISQIAKIFGKVSARRPPTRGYRGVDS